MRIVSVIVSALIVLLVVSFTVLNTTEVSIDLILNEKPIKVSFSLAMVIAFGLGALLGVLSASWVILKLKRANHRLEKKLHKAMPGLDMKSTLPPAERDVRKA